MIEFFEMLSWIIFSYLFGVCIGIYARGKKEEIESK